MKKILYCGILLTSGLLFAGEPKSTQTIPPQSIQRLTPKEHKYIKRGYVNSRYSMYSDEVVCCEGVGSGVVGVVALGAGCLEPSIFMKGALWCSAAHFFMGSQRAFEEWNTRKNLQKKKPKAK